MGKCKQCRMEESNHKMDCSNRGNVAQTQTKTVLGWVFTRDQYPHFWRCHTTEGVLELRDRGSAIEAILRSGSVEVANGLGPTDPDAILALQSKLRKMAELEVAK